MSQRHSEYERKERDLYETPAWVTEVLIPHIPRYVEKILEPACGSGKMMAPLKKAGYFVAGTDIEMGEDYLADRIIPAGIFDAIITNPPYAYALEFIEKSLPIAAFVSMLLRTDYDHAKSRQHLFQDQRFSKKIVLTKRIKWFEDSAGQPSFNHAWFVWDTTHSGAPTLAYGPASPVSTTEHPK